jgi:hypothetical protein
MRLNKKERNAKDFISIALDEHDDAEWKNTAKRLLSYYAGKDPARAGRRGDLFQVNTVVSLVNSLLPNFIIQSPFVRATPQNAVSIIKEGADYSSRNMIQAARVREKAINHLLKKVGMIGEQQKALKDAFFYPFGVTKVGYSYDTLSNYDSDYDCKDTPFIKRICPDDFLYHPLATGPDDSCKLGHRFVSSRSRLKEYDFIKNLDTIPVEVPAKYRDKVSKGKLSKAFFDQVTVYEVLDQEEQMYYYYAGVRGDVFIGKRPRDYKFKGSDYQILRFNQDNDSFAGLSLLGAVEDQIVAIDEFATLMVEHARKFTGQVFILEGTVDEDELEAIRTGEQGSVHVVKNIGGLNFKQPMPQGDYGMLMQMMQGIIDRILGVPDFARIGGSSRKSATESSFIQGDVSMRRAFYTNTVKEFVLSGVKKLASLQAQYQDNEEEILVMGSLEIDPIKYTKDDLQGDYLFDFDVDNMAFINQAELTNLMNALNIMAQQPLLQPILSDLDPSKVGNFIFKRLNINVDSLRTSQPESAVFVPAERENDIARKDEPMPQPKYGENHNAHLKAHFDDLINNGENNQILEHIAATIMIAQNEGVDVSNAVKEAKIKKQLKDQPLMNMQGPPQMQQLPAPQAQGPDLATMAQNLPPPAPNEMSAAPGSEMPLMPQ